MSREDDEFYCGSEESEIKEPINPFRVKEDTSPRNALREAIDRALGWDHPCGTEENPHVMEITEEGIDSHSLIEINLTGNRTQWRCIKCKSRPAIIFTRILRVNIELVEA
jgi:hypothetical protein